jgi:hypothetical protein
MICNQTDDKSNNNKFSKQIYCAKIEIIFLILAIK